MRGHQVEQSVRTPQHETVCLRWRAGSAKRATARVAVFVSGVGAAVALCASPVSAAMVVSYSAKSGQFDGGRLLVRGVSGRARYLTDAGRTGRMSLTRLHQRVFLPGKPPTGMLHIAGRDDDLAFKLSQPRYNAKGQTVSYAAKPLPGTQLSRGVTHHAPLQFADASLTVLPDPALGSTSNDCIMAVNNDTGDNLILQSSSNWSTDTWYTAPPGELNIGEYVDMESEGGFLRGCGFQATYGVAFGPEVTIAVSWAWGGGVSTTCTSTDTTQLVCQRHDTTVVGWDIAAA